MNCKRIFVSCLAVAILVVGICEIQGQEGLPSPDNSYYQPRVMLNYPLLSGNHIAANESISQSAEINVRDNGSGCGCGIPLLPTLVQQLRDTLYYIFPYRQMNRNRGFLFSERFYGSNCCGSSYLIPGVMVEDGLLETPTPATSVEEVPSKVVPTTSMVFPAAQERITTTIPVGNGVRSNLVRQVNYSVPSLSNTKQVPSIPDNPLRR